MLTKKDFKDFKENLPSKRYGHLSASKLRKEYLKHIHYVLRYHNYPLSLSIDLSFYCTHYNYKVLC